MDPVYQELSSKSPDKSRLLGKKPSPVERVCSQIHEMMLAVPPVQTKGTYNLQTHLTNLNNQEFSNVKGNIQLVKEVTGIDPELFINDGQAVKNELKKFLFPDVQPAVDAKLFMREERLTRVLKCVKKMFKRLSAALEQELKNMEKKYAFETFKEPIIAYHTVYNKYIDVFSWVEKNYKEVFSELNARNQSDQEKNASSYIAKITPTIIYDPEKARNDTLALLELTYSMEKDRPSKDLEGFHATTEKISTSLSNLESLYKGYSDFRALAERDWCKLTYLYINDLRLDSHYNKFDKEYDEEKPRDEREHFSLNKSLIVISPKLRHDIIPESNPLLADGDDNQ